MIISLSGVRDIVVASPLFAIFGSSTIDQLVKLYSDNIILPLASYIKNSTLSFSGSKNPEIFSLGIIFWSDNSNPSDVNIDGFIGAIDEDMMLMVI